MHPDVPGYTYFGHAEGLSSSQLSPILNSHGWLQLAPLESLPNGFIYPMQLTENLTTNVLIRSCRTGVAYYADVRPTVAVRARLSSVVKRVLSLDFPMAELRVACRARGAESFLRLAQRGWGRMLRSPTPWEDAVKTLFTTNASWPHTKQMCQRLVMAAGSRSRSGRNAFPFPSDVLRVLDDSEPQSLSIGYRSAFLAALAEAAQSTDSWLLQGDAKVSMPDVEERVSSWPGFGPYATAHLMVLLGDHSQLPVDREVGKHIGLHSPGAKLRLKPSGHLAEWGHFRFTAYRLQRAAERRV